VSTFCIFPLYNLGENVGDFFPDQFLEIRGKIPGNLGEIPENLGRYPDIRGKIPAIHGGNPGGISDSLFWRQVIPGPRVPNSENKNICRVGTFVV
jgi:hypothetical protein